MDVTFELIAVCGVVIGSFGIIAFAALRWRTERNRLRRDLSDTPFTFPRTASMLAEMDGHTAYIDASSDLRRSAAVALATTMQTLSQDTYFASWAVNAEYTLWRLRENGANDDDKELGITDRHCMILKLLSEECDGWWMYPIDENGKHVDTPLTFVTLEAWCEHVNQFRGYPGGFADFKGEKLPT